ncbi:unnamed protein product [Rhizophagus irregularis]|nr:unnamed protein product [Rhizophagus irregularis]CAB4389451.1 unnamed protein product [Rhizophagus irregularis]
MRQLKEIGLSLRTFSTSSIEKKNHNHVCLFFGELFVFDKGGWGKIYLYCGLVKVDLLFDENLLLDAL